MDELVERADQEPVIDATTAGVEEAAAPEQDDLEAEDPARVLLARLREEMLGSDPGVPAEMVSGDTLEELEVSFAAAKAVVGRVRQAVEEQRPPPIGGGAPGRVVRAPRTAFEKIREGSLAWADRTGQPWPRVDRLLPWDALGV
ncbi:MAG: hypothetical protein WEC33_01315 [Dehalococcoidia bacterium]